MQASPQQNFQNFLFSQVAGWLLKAQLCLLTAEFLFNVANHLIGQEKGREPILYENRFLSLMGGGNPKG